jgi:hypothetical protein
MAKEQIGPTCRTSYYRTLGTWLSRVEDRIHSRNKEFSSYETLFKWKSKGGKPMKLTLEDLVSHIKARYQELDSEYNNHPGSLENMGREDIMASMPNITKSKSC